MTHRAGKPVEGSEIKLRKKKDGKTRRLALVNQGNTTRASQRARTQPRRKHMPRTSVGSLITTPTVTWRFSRTNRTNEKDVERPSPPTRCPKASLPFQGCRGMCEDPQAARGSVGRGPLALSSFPFYRNLDHLALSWIDISGLPCQFKAAAFLTISTLKIIILTNVKRLLPRSKK